jgi:hypothetical protein
MRRPAAVLCVLCLCLLAAGVALSAPQHRAPCHSAHSCPSDHHSYVWFDAAGQGWDCAKPGAPELTATDTQAIFYGGLRYQCHRAGGGTRAASCGTDLWTLKVLTDPAAIDVNRVPRPTTVQALARLRPPASLDTRLPGAEMHVWRIEAHLVEQKLEDDSDVHLVVRDSATGARLVVEFPSPACAVGSPVVGAIRAARAALAHACGVATRSFAELNGSATIEGVGFFDRQHGQIGAPNAVELHPVLKFSPGPERC